MNNPGKAAIVTGGTFGLFAVGFAAIVSHPVVLAAALYSTYQVGKAAYDRNRQPTTGTGQESSLPLRGGLQKRISLCNKHWELRMH
jgi:hypothetical protein